MARYVAIGTSFDTTVWLDTVDKTAQVNLVAELSWFTYREWVRRSEATRSAPGRVTGRPMCRQP